MLDPTIMPRLVCEVCHKRLPNPTKRPYRKTCSNACRQKLYRMAHRQRGWLVRRKWKSDRARLALPLTERVFAEKQESIWKLSERRNIYQCQTCGERFLAERINKTQRVSAFCSERCEQKARHHWKHYRKAAERAREAGRLDPRVAERQALRKLSPLCPHCGLPFAPNTTVDGRKLAGRPRKYCSDVCRQAAYEKRYKHKNSVSRRHRFHECAECGTSFDRTDKHGRLTRRFCSKRCSHRYQERVKRARHRVMVEYQRKDKWLRSFNRGTEKHGYAERNSTKQKMKRLAESGKFMGLGKRARLGGWRLGE